MPGMSDQPGTRLASASPPSTMFDDKNPTYMTMTMPTTSSAPSEPNWPRVCTICGTPSVGPWAACSAMKIAPMKFPAVSATTAQVKERSNTVTDNAPVTMVSNWTFDPNQMVKRSRALPWR